MQRWTRILPALLMMLGQPLLALEMSYSPSYGSGNRFDDPFIYLEGVVEYGDDQKLAQLLNSHPDVVEIVVGISPGGNLHAGIQIAQLINRRDLHVRLEGPAASAATVISLGSKTRIRFQGDFAIQEGTSLLFHCAYLRGNDYCDEPATRASANLLAGFTPWSVDRWMDVLMSTSPATVERISLWDLLDDTRWSCEAEAHLSVVCFTENYQPPAIAPAPQPAAPTVQIICNRQGPVTNIRRGPSAKNYDILESVSNGQAVTVLQEVVNPDGYLYLEIEFSLPHYQDTVIGYVYHEAVSQNCS